jgi:hypothetical protein
MLHVTALGIDGSNRFLIGDDGFQIDLGDVKEQLWRHRGRLLEMKKVKGNRKRVKGWEPRARILLPFTF